MLAGPLSRCARSLESIGAAQPARVRSAEPAHFFVDGPRHGSAAGAIASLLGIDPTRYPDDYSWARFRHQLDFGRFQTRLRNDPVLRYKVHLLEKIADQPEAQRFSAYSMGGGPGAIFAQVQKIFCHNMTADPGSIPIINTYFAHPAVGSCASASQIAAATPTFRRQIDEMAAGTGRRPAVYLLEIDGFGSSSCMARMGTLGRIRGAAPLRGQHDRIPPPHGRLHGGRILRRELGLLHGAGCSMPWGCRRSAASSPTTPTRTGRSRRSAGPRRSHARTHGAHFIVNTAQNGNGPKRNPHPVTQGNEDLCNPPGRGLGPRLTTVTGFPRGRCVHVDARPGQQQRHLPRRTAVGDVLAGAGDRSGGARQRAARAGVRERSLLRAVRP